MPKLSLDLTTGTMHPREDLFAFGSMAVANAELIALADGCSTTTVRLNGVFVGTLVLEGLTENSTWDLIPVRNIQGGAYQVSMTTTGGFVANCALYRKTRLRMSAWTSGSATTYFQNSIGVFEQAINSAITPLLIHTSAAVGVALTATLPAPGIGLRQYLTHLRIEKFATALLTAAAAPVLVTTTNLPNTPSIAFPADAAAAGTMFPYQGDFSRPIMANAQNTAVTIVMPATPLIIWRATVGYFVAP